MLLGVWRLEDNLAISSYLVDAWSLVSAAILCTSNYLAWKLPDNSIHTSHLSIWILRLQMCTTTSSFLHGLQGSIELSLLDLLVWLGFLLSFLPDTSSTILIDGITVYYSYLEILCTDFNYVIILLWWKSHLNTNF